MSAVILSRGDLVLDVYHRRRRCAECGRQWPTMESLDRERFRAEVQALGLRLTDLDLEEE